MSSTADRAEIGALFEQLVRAQADRDADAIVETYAPDAVIYELAPALGRRGMNRDSVAAWLQKWDGPIQIDAPDVDLTVGGDVAFASGLNRMRGRQGGEDQDLWYRMTMCLRRTRGDSASSTTIRPCPSTWMGAIARLLILSRRGSRGMKVRHDGPWATRGGRSREVRGLIRR
jgi:ketosteroid isomerase-like protein